MEYWSIGDKRSEIQRLNPGGWFWAFSSFPTIPPFHHSIIPVFIPCDAFVLDKNSLESLCALQ
jgi:hypothetical protein